MVDNRVVIIGVAAGPVITNFTFWGAVLNLEHRPAADVVDSLVNRVAVFGGDCRK